jgi:hypothetical protein
MVGRHRGMLKIRKYVGPFLGDLVPILSRDVAVSSERDQKRSLMKNWTSLPSQLASRRTLNG